MSSSQEKLKIFVTTWNMGNAEPQGMEAIFEEKQAIGQYDLIVIGLQESTYSVKAGNGSDSISHLGKHIRDILGDQYEELEHCFRAQLQLYVFILKSKRHRIVGKPEKSIENTGILHVFPNKGGLLVTLTIDGTKLAFVSCHLTAHEGVKHCEERNASIVEILGGVRAGDTRIDITEQFHHVFWMGDMNYRTTFETNKVPSSTKKNILALRAQRGQAVSTHVISSNNNNSTAASEDVQLTLASNAEDDDDEEEEEEEDEEEGSGSGGKSGGVGKKEQHQQDRQRVIEWIKHGRFDEIIAHDELNREIAANRVLNDFIALQPKHFPPTFKRQRGIALTPEILSNKSTGSNTNSQEIQSFYHPKRIPSYTDRILYKSMPTFASALEAKFFDSCEAAISSDHKPVRAGFEVNIYRGISAIRVDSKLIHKRSSSSNNNNTPHALLPKTLKFVITNLQGHDLEEMDAAMFGGLSDPYIVITTDPAPLLLTRSGRLKTDGNITNYGIKTSVVKHNIDPKWPDVIPLQFASIDIEKLEENASLIFAVWDEDLTNADDLIGVATLPFRTIFNTFQDQLKRAGKVNKDDRLSFSYHFDHLFIRSNSEIMGSISGTITLDGDYREILNDFQTLLTASQSSSGSNSHALLPLSEALALSQNTLCSCSIF